jgi:hypothetical protein
MPQKPGPDPDRADRVVALEILQRLGREHHAPAESVVGAVALDDGDLVGGVPQLHGNGKIEAGRAAAENRNLHPCDLLLICYKYCTEAALFQA